MENCSQNSLEELKQKHQLKLKTLITIWVLVMFTASLYVMW